MSIKKYKYIDKQSFNIKESKTKDKGEFSSREDAVEEFISNLKEIHLLQQRLYAERKEGVIFVFQAMDAAGKDGTIRTVFSTLSPHGVKEFCFKAPSSEELSHDYLWRFWSALPAKGHISIFNRSYYEDVLIGKVHKLYEKQLVPDRIAKVDVIKKRYKEINDFEKYLYNNGTRVVKIFLNVSKDEQAKRFISRIDTPSKNWKISEGDIKEREFWDEYQEAFETMINNTASKTSPWYVVPADHKWYARLIVSRIVLKTLQEINPQFPTTSKDELDKVLSYREELINSISDEKYKKKISKSKEENKAANIVDDNKAENKEENSTSTEVEPANESGSNEKTKKKDKKHNKKKDKKKKTAYDELPDDVKEEMESVFVDSSVVVTDTIIESEQEKIEEKDGNEKTNDDEKAEVANES